MCRPDCFHGAGGTGALTKSGGSTVTLTAANTYSGATLVNVGTLALGAGREHFNLRAI